MSRHNNTMAHQAFASKDYSSVQQWVNCQNGYDKLALFCDGSVLLVTGEAPAK